MNIKLYPKSLVVMVFLLASIQDTATAVPAETLEQFSENPIWRAIIDATNQLVDSDSNPEFFFSNGNPTDYQEELAATIRAGSHSNICLYPARYSFVRDFIDPSISFAHCSELNEFLSAADGDNLSIVFASPYSGSPMSYFGHTFLLIENAQRPMFSAAIGFAAEIPDQMGGFELSWRGLTGFLPARFTVEPLFLLRHKYLVEEQRYLLHYRTNFEAPEIKRILYFLFEIGAADFSYAFFSVNCTSQLVPLLGVGRPSLRNDSRLLPVTYPSDLVDLVVENDAVIATTSEAPIADSAFDFLWRSEREVRTNFRSVLRQRDKEAVLQSLSLDEEQENEVKRLLVDHYQVLFYRYGRANSDYSDVLSLGFPPPDYQEIEYPGRVRHPMSLQFGWTSGVADDQLIITYRPALVSRAENASSLLGEASLEFFSISTAVGLGSVFLSQLTLANLESFTRINRFSRTPSWVLQASINRHPVSQRYYFAGEVGLGASLGPRSFFVFVLPSVEVRSIQPHITPTLSLGGVLRYRNLRVSHDSDFVFEGRVTAPRSSVFELSVMILDRIRLESNYDLVSEQIGANVSYFF